MLMPASSEFIALCRSQVNLLTNSLDAALSIVYLTEELADVVDTKLVPVVAYPEAITSWNEEQIFTLLLREQAKAEPPPHLLISDASAQRLPTPSALSTPSAPPEVAPSLQSDNDLQPLQAAEKALLQQQQIVLPLMHQEMVMGLLVTARADRAWSTQETEQIEQIAQTLAIACLLDQRTQWLAQDMRQQRLLRERKHDLFDTLLHQFRNPLTALRTFGKLLLKRLKPEDANRSVIEGIIRESDRLQELLQQFDAAVDLDEADLRQLLAASDDFTADSITDDEERATWIGADLMSPASDPAATSGNTSASLLPSSAAARPLLPSSNILAGGSIQQTAHAIAEVLEPLLASAEAIAQDRQLTIYADFPTDLPQVQIDTRALREVLNNLLDNALKYTPAGGQIDICVRSSPSPERVKQQAIVIADTGPGIPPQDLTHLFERHYRGVQANTEIPGTGLGLAIARELIHQMQGEIQIFSPAAASQLVPQRKNRLNQNQYPGTAVVVWLPECN
ncbi:MAG: hypothetical protein Kow00121_53720 [Elainellaceae cyanobacterium]